MQLLHTDLKPMLQVLAHQASGAGWYAQVIGKGVSEKKYSSRRCEKNRTARAQSLVHGQGYGRSAQGMADQAMDGSESASNIFERPGKLGQGSLVPH